MTPRKPYLVDVDDDGLAALDVNVWAEDKYIRSTMYAELFATGMKARWKRVYVGICTGPGHVRIRESNRRVLGASLLALQRLPDRFDRYIFCDLNEQYLDALRQRVDRDYPGSDVKYVLGDVNLTIDQIVNEIPDHVLTFVFIDPFQLNIGFNVIRSLSRHGNVDILLTLMLYPDANRAWHNYIRDHNRKVDRFLEDPNWRGRWEEASLHNEHPVSFLAGEFGRKMEQEGYISPGLEGMYQVRAPVRNTPLYHMAFFSRDQRGMDFWKKVLKYSSDQRELPLG